MANSSSVTMRSEVRDSPEEKLPAGVRKMFAEGCQVGTVACRGWELGVLRCGE